jgi:uncharacterized membrane protein
MGWGVFVAGLAVFFGSHVWSGVRTRAPGRDIRVRMGNGFRALYSVVSLAGFALIVWGYMQLRPESATLWTPPGWTKHVAFTLMWPAFVLLVAAYTPAGIIAKVARHPMLAAVKLWATAHLIANGDLVSTLLFGSFLAYAVFARIVAKRRGDNGPTDARAGAGDIMALVIGTGVYAGVLLWAHPYIAGVGLVG